MKNYVYDKTKYILSTYGDESDHLYETYVKGVIIPEFEEVYGIKLKYTNPLNMIKQLEELKKSGVIELRESTLQSFVD